MGFSTIDANSINQQDKPQSSLIKCKLRITLLFCTTTSSQIAKRNAFRQGQNASNEAEDGNIAEEMSGATVQFTDQDDNKGDYKIIDKTCVVQENSPKAMENMANAIDGYINGYSISPDVEEVIPCFFVPSFSDSPVIPTLFFHTFPFKSLEHPNCKVKPKKGNVCLFGLDTINSKYPPANSNDSGGNSNLSQTMIQLCALMCVYTYFYNDCIEQKGWSVYKEDLSKQSVIEDYINKHPLFKPIPKANFWTKLLSHIQKCVGIPKSTIESIIDTLFYYDKHLKNRIYNRIIGILEVVNHNNGTKMSKSYCAIKIREVMATFGRPDGFYAFFDKCDYFNSIKNNALLQECKKWTVSRSDTGFASGYGALVFSNGNDIIYCFKGTDFDSYWRDWISTNLLQGLTGLSLQHHNAVKYGIKLDKKVSTKGNLLFTGHSLGGGLASSAAIATANRECVSFNAAGLNFWGVQVNKLLHNRRAILHPNDCWKRVHPFRIRGEVLDTLQKTLLRGMTFGSLERGYGKESVELDIEEMGKSCNEKHDMTNFLYKETLYSLQPFSQVRKASPKSDKTNKVIKIEFNTKNIKSTIPLS